MTRPEAWARCASPSLTAAPCRAAALAGDVHRGGVRPQGREQPLRVRAGHLGHVADLRGSGPAGQQRLADLLGVFVGFGQGEGSDLPVADVGFADIGQARG